MRRWATMAAVVFCGTSEAVSAAGTPPAWCNDIKSALSQTSGELNATPAGYERNNLQKRYDRIKQGLDACLAEDASSYEPTPVACAIQYQGFRAAAFSSVAGQSGDVLRKRYADSIPGLRAALLQCVSVERPKEAADRARRVEEAARAARAAERQAEEAKLAQAAQVAAAKAESEARDAILANAKEMAVAYAVAICQIAGQRQAALDEVSKEKKYSQVAGMVNKVKMYNLQRLVRFCDERVAKLRAQAKQQSVPAIPACPSASVRKVLACAASLNEGCGPREVALSSMFKSVVDDEIYEEDE